MGDASNWGLKIVSLKNSFTIQVREGSTKDRCHHLSQRARGEGAAG